MQSMLDAVVYLLSVGTREGEESPKGGGKKEEEEGGGVEGGGITIMKTKLYPSR